MGIKEVRQAKQAPMDIEQTAQGKASRKGPPGMWVAGDAREGACRSAAAGSGRPQVSW